MVLQERTDAVQELCEREYCTSLDAQAEILTLRARVAELEQALLVQQRRGREAALLTVVFDNLDDGLLLLDSSDVVLAVNPAMAQLLGSTPATLQGSDWVSICNASEGLIPGRLVQQARHSQQGQHGRVQCARRDGRRQMLDIWVLPLLQPEAYGPWVMLHVVDVTERLDWEARLIQRERRAARDGLTAMIAHEVNTPLQALQSALYLAGRASDQQRVRYLATANREIDRISAILRRLLDLHHVSDEPPAPISLNTLVSWLLDLLHLMLAEQHIWVKTDLQSDLPWLWGKADDLVQVLLNLIVNATEAMPEGGTLSIRTYLASGLQAADQLQVQVLLEITDTGCGMTPDIQSQIFDPFFTTRPGKPGVGLTVSKKIITEHDGTISVRSTPNRGSTFTLTFPISSAVVPLP